MSDDSIPSLPDRVQFGLSISIIAGLAIVPALVLCLVALDGGLTPLVTEIGLWLFIAGFGFPLWVSVVIEAAAYINPNADRS